LRSPVSGSTGMAEAGTLTALVSGPKPAFDNMADIFAVFSKKAFHLGESEEARFLKLAINSMVAATSALMGEALAFGMKGGLTHEVMLEVITQSAVASPLIGYKKDMIISGDYTPAATLDMLKKDLDLLLTTAHGQHLHMPVNNMIRDIYSAASDNGLGGQDFFVLVQEAEKASGKKLK
jgi:3-hydroxyisobutyrate dehydrogenase-like beta-hydroxyacid dehydrogenase